MIKEAIILSGGESWRLKPDVWVPKPMLKLNSFTLLEHQIRWLLNNGIERVIVACDQKYEVRQIFDPYVTWSVEPYKKGTGGAVLNAIDNVKGDNCYLMNVDDIVWYNPQLMYPINNECRAKILVSKPFMDYGRVELRQDLVMGFREKPYLDFYVSAGHYWFKKSIIEQYFPDDGNLENKTLPELSHRRLLKAEKLNGQWITINTMKDYMRAQELLGSK